MVLILKEGAFPGDIEAFKMWAADAGIALVDIFLGASHMLLAPGKPKGLDIGRALSFKCVERAIEADEPYELANKALRPEGTIIGEGIHRFGGGSFSVIAGPCAVESEEQAVSTALAVKAAGARFLRGGAFKARTSPYDFQGLGIEGLRLLKLAKGQTGLPIVSEITSIEHIEAFARDVDIIQIGARNMQDYALLHEVGKLKKTVLLKRGFGSTIDELLMSAEHLMSSGTGDIILCERGIRTFETSTRSTLDISAVPALKNKTHLPVIIDPSHAAGQWGLVEPLALAGVAAGCDGLIVEVHIEPSKALSDKDQSLDPNAFRRLMTRVRKLREAIEAF